MSPSTSRDGPRPLAPARAALPHRIIWAFALGYFVFYTPYAALIKIVTTGYLGEAARLSGLEMLPAVALGTAGTATAIIFLLGWWTHFRRPRVHVVISGVGTAAIIATTTLMFAFRDVSILLALLAMRCGVLVIAPLVDLVAGRKVRWFSWAALALSLVAGAVTVVNVDGRLSQGVGLCLALYLAGYVLRLSCMTSTAKCEDTALTRRYLVQEAAVALAALVLVPALLAAIGEGSIGADLRRGFLVLTNPLAAWPAFLIGALYACLFVFGTLVYLDRRENTFCVPLNRGSSLLAGIVAASALAWSLGSPPPAPSLLAAAAIVLLALLLLSPFHHAIEHVVHLVVAGRDAVVTPLSPPPAFEPRLVSALSSRPPGLGVGDVGDEGDEVSRWR